MLLSYLGQRLHTYHVITSSRHERTEYGQSDKPAQSRGEWFQRCMTMHTHTNQWEMSVATAKRFKSWGVGPDLHTLPSAARQQQHNYKLKMAENNNVQAGFVRLRCAGKHDKNFPANTNMTSDMIANLFSVSNTIAYPFYLLLLHI